MSNWRALADQLAFGPEVVTLAARFTDFPSIILGNVPGFPQSARGITEPPLNTELPLSVFYTDPFISHDHFPHGYPVDPDN